MTMRRTSNGFALALWLIAMIATPPLVAAQDDPPEGQVSEEAEVEVLEGHSNHGETFNEGPRQAAYLMGTTGGVHFEITTSTLESQAYFDQGLGQLHGFWFFEAERTFRQAAAIDPDCAMHYWGMAMANEENNRGRAQGFIAEAVARIDQASERERMWIVAMDRYLSDDLERKPRRQRYVTDLEEIVAAYPTDVEAKAFLVLAHWHNSQRGIKIESHEALEEIIQEVLAVERMHPIHHYAIHLWDYKDPSRALASAANCGPSAPGIAHMWHMPGHIYSDLRRFADAAWQQEASARVDHAQMMRDGLMPDQIFNFAHNNEWLVRNLMNMGRIHDAIDLAKNMIELPRHPSYNTLRRQGSARFGRTRLFEILSRFEMWPELVELADTVYLEPTDSMRRQATRARRLGAAQYLMGDIQGGDASLQALKMMKSFGTRRIDDAIDEVAGYEAMAKGDPEKAVEIFDEIRRFDRCARALAHLAAGDTDAAIRVAEEAVRRAEGTVRPLAVLAWIHWNDGRQEDAAATFERLRAISSDIDLDVPVFARLAPLAESCGAPGDWRVPRELPADLGARPDLEPLGPFRWQPSPAPTWSLPNDAGGTASLADYAGRPVIVIFYLGYGCLHCVEQLVAFAPMTEAFREAGIEMIAISTDPVADLRKSVDAYQADAQEPTGAFPFPLVSNAGLDVFKNYRVYDDFEQMELHGTFLIDGNGLVRWRDVSYEPFMDPEFLLKESLRLLAEPDAAIGD